MGDRKWTLTNVPLYDRSVPQGEFDRRHSLRQVYTKSGTLGHVVLRCRPFKEIPFRVLRLFAYDQRPLLLDNIFFRADIQKTDNHLLGGIKGEDIKCQFG